MDIYSNIPGTINSKANNTTHGSSARIHESHNSSTAPHRWSWGIKDAVAYKPTRPALSQEISLRHRRGTMQWVRAIVGRYWWGLTGRPYSFYCFWCEPVFDPAHVWNRHDALNSPSTICICIMSPLPWCQRCTKQRPRGARSEAACARRWWRWLLSYNRGTRCRQRRQQYCYCTWCMVFVICGIVSGMVLVPYEVKWNACFFLRRPGETAVG